MQNIGSPNKISAGSRNIFQLVAVSVNMLPNMNKYKYCMIVTYITKFHSKVKIKQ